MAESGDEAPESLRKLLNERERSINEAQARLDELEHRAGEQSNLTAEQVVASLREQVTKLLDMNPEAGVLLERLVPGKIRAVPYRQSGSDKVVLRAECELCLVNILPAHLLAAPEGGPVPPAEWAKPIAIVVDLFKPSIAAANAVWAAELRPFLTLAEIGKVLGISKRGAHLAAELGDKMRANQIIDPYVRLSQPPKTASRWRSREERRAIARRGVRPEESA